MALTDDASTLSERRYFKTSIAEVMWFARLPALKPLMQRRYPSTYLVYGRALCFSNLFEGEGQQGQGGSVRSLTKNTSTSENCSNEGA